MFNSKHGCVGCAALFFLLAVVTVAQKPAMYIFGDIHYDPYYGTNWSVSVNGTCNTSDAPKYGTYNCDTPPTLLESAIADIYGQAAIDGDGIVLMTGDFVRHKMRYFDLPEPNLRVRELAVLQNITDTIASLIVKYQQKYIDESAGTRNGLKWVVHPSAYALVDGNEDCLPHYFFLPEKQPAVHEALVRLTASMKNHGLMSPDEADEFGQCAYYSIRPNNTNLVILALNTIIYSVQHRPNTSGNVSDPCGQLVWLESQLTAAMTANQRVMILGHIIPDATKWYPEYLDAYRTLVMNFGNVIAAQWYGHTHMFTFLTLSEHLAPVLFDIPGITPRDGNMPAYIKVTFTDQTEFGPLNQSQWMIEEIKMRFYDIRSLSPEPPVWQYGMSLPQNFSDYLTSPVNSDQLYQFGVALLEDKKSNAAWEQFQQMYFGGAVWPNLVMGKKDKAEVLCKAVTASRDDYNKCKEDYK